MRRVLVIGAGGREHALAAAFKRSPSVEFVAVAPGNIGMTDVAQCLPIAMDDFETIKVAIETHRIDLVFVGPESPLSQGIVDALSSLDITIFGPTQAAARLESSKSYAKQIMNRYGIPTADHVSIHSFNAALEHLLTHPAPIVIKADGLMAGKGVTVAMSDDEAKQALIDIYATQADATVVIETYLEGEEFSLLCFVHEDHVLPLPLARDHKRVHDGDMGPNTGGMGAYSPVPQISQAILDEAMETVMKPMAKAMVTEGVPFTGILYGGLMATRQGVKTIEFNVRFGDPETEVILPRLLSPLDQVIDAVLEKRPIELSIDPRFCLGVVLASEGYPGPTRSSLPIEGLDRIQNHVYHMGTSMKDGHIVNIGGRVLLVHDFGETLSEAQAKAYAQVRKIEAPHLFYRSDIGD